MSALLDTYVAPDDTAIRGFLQRAYEYFESNNVVEVNEGRVERWVGSIKIGDDGTTGAVHQCVVAITFDVPRPTDSAAPTTAPAEDETVWAEYYYDWSKQPDGTWLITHSEWGFDLERPDGSFTDGSLPSVSAEDITACFDEPRPAGS